MFTLKQRRNIVYLLLATLLTIFINITSPFCFKKIIENFGDHNSSISLSIVALYCISWFFVQISNEIRRIITFPLFTCTILRLSQNFFEHINNLTISMFYKLKKGHIVNALERAQSSLPNLLTGTFFLIIPTTIELIIVSIIFGFKYSIYYSCILSATFVLFNLYTYNILQMVTNKQKAYNKKRHIHTIYMKF